MLRCSKPLEAAPGDPKFFRQAAGRQASRSEKRHHPLMTHLESARGRTQGKARQWMSPVQEKDRPHEFSSHSREILRRFVQWETLFVIVWPPWVVARELVQKAAGSHNWPDSAAMGGYPSQAPGILKMGLFLGFPVLRPGSMDCAGIRRLLAAVT